MPRARRARRAVALALVCASCGALRGSRSGKDEAQDPSLLPVCEVDQVREYFCDELLPLHAAEPADAPYDDCPARVSSHTGVLAGRPEAAPFDADYTRHIRLRQPPGNSCCYSWCARPTLADPSAIDPKARCGHHHSQRESYCFEQPERGTRQPAPGGYDGCPSAIVPPEGAAFAAPREGALFDGIYSAQRRQLGFNECCYAWCSVVPGVGEPVQREY